MVRLWREDPELYLTGGVNLVPLAPLTDVAEADLPGLVRRMAERIDPEPGPRADMLWMAALLLMGYRYDETLATRLVKGVWKNMRDSTTYQAILKEGRQDGQISEARRLLLMLGVNRFGEPGEATRVAFEAIRDVERLETMIRRIYETNASDWDGLLNTP